MMGSDSFQSVAHLTHRKSVEYLNMSSNSSAASSSCASASSSPVAKQKSISQSIVGRLFNPNPTKGKENSSSEYVKTNNSKSTPSNTPTHQKKSGNGGQFKGNGSQKSNDRKVLSSSENNHVASSKLSKTSAAKPTTTTTAVSQGQSSFDFEIEDVDEENEWGWKTYTSRGRNNRPNNASSNGGKRYSDGNLGGIANDELISEKENGSENNNEIDTEDSRRDSLQEKKSPSSGSSQPSSGSSVSGTSSSSNNNVGGPQSQRKGREKDKGKPRRDGMFSLNLNVFNRLKINF